MDNNVILLVDDETDILEFVSYNLKKEGFEVYTANNGRQAIHTATKIRPSLILLDVMMPEMDGIETCEELRRIPALEHTVIAFLTARNEDYSQIAGFDAGADDYIAKPIKPKVLISRVKALLKRLRPSGDGDGTGNNTNIVLGDITINKEKHLVKVGEEELVLPRKEFKLLLLLSTKPNRVFTRDEIYNAVWGDDIVVGDRTIDVHIRKLREKIGNDRIRTIKGIGYKFALD